MRDFEKLVSPGFKDESVGGIALPPIMRILNSSEEPKDAFVVVPYRNHWFWIDDKDLRSKGLFSFLTSIFNLVDTGLKEGAPVVTIPAK